ncbi:MAG: hypothetical protein JXR79_02145 [Nitrospirae bacterium]|nr:hypothetical protein [Nitrospirota bacterium]
MKSTLKKEAELVEGGFKLDVSSENIGTALTLNCGIAPDPLSQLVTCGPAMLLSAVNIFKTIIGSRAGKQIIEDLKNYEKEGDEPVSSCRTSMAGKDAVSIQLAAAPVKDKQPAEAENKPQPENETTAKDKQPAKEPDTIKIECSKSNGMIKARLYRNNILIRQAIRLETPKPEKVAEANKID